MSKIATQNDLCSICDITAGLDCKGWMDLAQSVRAMVAKCGDKCMNLSIDNILYDKKTKTCRLFNKNEVQHGGDPIKLRWYPPCIWDNLNKMFYYYDMIAALVVVEFIYGTSPFYHKDEAQFRANIRDQFRTACPTRCKNLREHSKMIDFTNYDTHKVIWMLMYTFTGAARLEAGQRYLDTCKRCYRKTEEQVIKKWNFRSTRRMPKPEAKSEPVVQLAPEVKSAPEVQPKPESYSGERDSITSPSSSPSNANQAELRPDHSENKKTVDTETVPLSDKNPSGRVPMKSE